MPNNLNRYCYSCTFWQWGSNIKLADGEVIFPGHCGLCSIKCINAVADGDKTPPSFLPMKEVTYAEEKVLET